MIQNGQRHASRFFLLSLETIAKESENLISTIGYQEVAPRQDYPVSEIPRRYSFALENGRNLAEFQLVYITAGTGVFNDRSGSRVVTPGTLFLLRPGYWHSYRPNRDTGWTEYYIGFNGPVFREATDRLFQGKKGPLEIGMSATLVDLFEQALFYAERQCGQTMSMLETIVMHMLALINYNIETRNRTDDKTAQAINAVKQHMANHLSEQIDMQALAKSLGMSYTWLRRIFRKNTGMPPAQYLQQLRIHSSMYFLRNSTLSVKNIALDCGFSTSEYYCTVFQETVGMSPGTYRSTHVIQDEEAVESGNAGE